ncbi:tetratricopeptide repeat protein [Zavarzinia sp. CC-PAN008]|uniref:tetratricopeptide repeat protein n=1 Tax=Zavarzinia sp. CC-PAN008 TaxID=3243332 RepID=UPI003F74780D
MVHPPHPALAQVVLVLLVLALSAAAWPAQAREDEMLDRLFAQLKAAGSPAEAAPIEARIWDAWMHSGNPRADQLVLRGTRAMQMRQGGIALALFNAAIEMEPDFAEAWNKRATLYYLLDQYDKSIADCARVLMLEPRHFGALSGLAMIHLERGDKAKALDAFRRALAVNPNLPGAAAHVDALAEEVEGKPI